MPRYNYLSNKMGLYLYSKIMWIIYFVAFVESFAFGIDHCQLSIGKRIQFVSVSIFFSLNFSSSCLSLSLIRSCMWKRQSLQYSICSNFESIECTLANHYRRLFWNAFRAQINLDLVGQWKHSMQNHSSTSNIIDR